MIGFEGELEKGYGALNGALEGAYVYTENDAGGIKTSTHGIEQRYNLRVFNNLWDPRLGSFSGGVNWADDQTSYSAPIDDSRRNLVKDYNLNFSLLPRFSPLTVYAQKTDRENRFSTVSHDTVSTYGFSWMVSSAVFPRIGINGAHTSLSTDQAGVLPASDIDYLMVDTGGRLGSYHLSARYLYDQTKDPVGNATWSHGVNLNLNGAITRALTLGAYANLATRGGNLPGVGFYQENGAGMNLYYLPNRYWDSNLRADFNESPGSNNFKRSLFSGGLNLHPTEKLDWSNGAQYSRFEAGTSQTQTVYANTGANYRPFFGLNLNGGISGGITQVTGGGLSSRSHFDLVNWSASYFKVLQAIRLTTGYGGSLGENTSEMLGKSSDSTHSFSAGIDNTQTQIVHAGLNGSLTLVNRSVPTRSENEIETRLSATADSRYFRDFIFYNDLLLLDGTVTYYHVSGIGLEGETISEEAHANYQFLNMFTLLGSYLHIDYPHGSYQSSTQTASLGFLGTIRPWINGLWTFDLKGIFNGSESLTGQQTYDAHTRLSHQIGLLSVTADYDYLRNEIGSILNVSQQVMFRAIRSF
ncbi:MAG: hypothetical protein HYR81_00080 [Nitrospirae bacterium]|nr:hypothetical protein [Nitrospirota bacterium]